MTTFTVANLADLKLAVTPVAASGLSSYTAQAVGLFVLTGNSQAMSFTLPASGLLQVGNIVTVKRGDGSRFAINVLPSGTAQIDSATQATISNAFGVLSVQWDGTNWWVVGRG